MEGITNLPQELNFADWTEEELKSLDNLFILLRVQSGEELPSFAIVEGNRLMDKFTFLAPDEKAVIVLISDTLSHIVKERQHLRNVLVTKQGISDVKGELVTLGPNNTTVSRKVLLKMDWTNCRQVTRALLRATFTRETLSTHSLTGKPSPAFKHENKQTKEQLNVQIVDDIVKFVMTKCNVRATEVRSVITTMCADENKVKRQKAQKELAQKELAQKGLAQKELTQKELAQKELAQKKLAQKELAQKELAHKASGSNNKENIPE